MRSAFVRAQLLSFCSKGKAAVSALQCKKEVDEIQKFSVRRAELRVSCVGQAAQNDYILMPSVAKGHCAHNTKAWLASQSAERSLDYIYWFSLRKKNVQLTSHA